MKFWEEKTKKSKSAKVKLLLWNVYFSNKKINFLMSVRSYE